MLGDEVERRLHDLTLDFGVVTRAAVSRPLQLKELGDWRLKLWVPKTLCQTARQAERAFTDKRLPVVWPAASCPRSEFSALDDYEPALTCTNFLEARVALEEKGLAAFLPDFLTSRTGLMSAATALPYLSRTQPSSTTAWLGTRDCYASTPTPGIGEMRSWSHSLGSSQRALLVPGQRPDSNQPSVVLRWIIPAVQAGKQARKSL